MKCFRCGTWDGERCACKDGQTIFHGDCREILPQLPKVDLVLTDPPYGINADERQAARANKQHGKAAAPSKDYGTSSWDSEPVDGWTLSSLMQAGRDVIIWGANHYGMPPASCWLVWDKDNGSNGYADCELAWTNFDKAVRKFRYKWQGMLQEHAGRNKEARFHPTQKPVSVFKWCIELAGDAETVLDTHLGSGTTLRACKDLGRRGIGIEIEERYCEIGAERLRQGVLL